jgi:hypothetical protein
VSEPTAPPPGEPTGSTDRKALKQEAAAAKARRKAARPWYTKKRFIIPLVLVLLIILVNLSDGEGGDTDGEVATEPTDETTTDESAEEAPEETTDDVPDEVPDDAEFAGIGQEARDGNFAFTVNSLENIGSTLEAEEEFMDDAQASGEFYVLDVTVENIGNEAQSLFASNQYLYDADERRFSASDDFEVLLAIDTPVFEQLNPGAVMDGRVVFDVPEGVEIEFAELHDSAFSGGVLVDLRE